MPGEESIVISFSVAKRRHLVQYVGGSAYEYHHGVRIIQCLRITAFLHVVFSTKYRKPHLLHEWRSDLHSYIGGVVKDHKSCLLRAGGIEDHVHLLLRIHPDYAVAKTIQLLKTNSSKWINDLRFLKGKFQWQPGYGAFSVSQSMSETVKRYIDHQEAHHRSQTFESEYVDLLKKHQIEYNPRFVFETEFVG